MSNLKFGVMCSGTKFRSWQAQCIRDLISIEGVELSLLILEDNSGQSTDLSKELISKNHKIKLKFLTLLNQIISLVYFFLNLNLFSIYKSKFVKTEVDQPVDLTDLLINIDKISCKVIKKGKYSQFFRDEDVKEICNHQLDFILRFGFNIIRGEILTSAKYGIWSFHHDDEEKYRGGPACFWEIYYNDPVTGAILQKLTDRLDGGIVLKKGFFKTNLRSFSGNIDGVYVEAARWPKYVVKDIQNQNADYFNNPPSRTQAPIYRMPTNLQMISFFFKLFKNNYIYTRQNINKIAQWNVGIIYEPIGKFLEPDFKYQIQWYPLKKADKFFLADPFAIQKGDDVNIFCEKCDLITNVGEIFSIELKNRTFSLPKKYFNNCQYHLSYPFIFEYLGEIFLIPESRQIREIILYKAEKFPEKWMKITTIAQGIDAVDATIFFYNNAWWIFYTDQSIGFNNNLCILYANNLFGPWHFHSKNPVKQDIRSSRPAGTPFIYKQNLYRPSQDCSRSYGGSITINKITEITASDFKEETVTTINPTPPFSFGTHTISSVGKYTLIDGYRLIPKIFR